jgi:hypothetical protein
MGVVFDKLSLDTGNAGIDNGSGGGRFLLMRASVRENCNKFVLRIYCRILLRKGENASGV